MYRLIFAANGLVRQDYGQRAGNSGTPVVVEPGQAVSGLTMRMIPTGALSGRITDSAGQGLSAVQIQLLRFAYDSSGKRTAKTVATARTDDRGDYRFYYLSPGRYIVQAGIPSGTGAYGGVYGGDDIVFGGGDLDIYSEIGYEGIMGIGPQYFVSPNRVDQRYTRMYYPGTVDPDTAAPVEIPAGSEASGIDFVMTTEKLFRVRGRILDPRTGQPPRSASIMLTTPEGASNGRYVQQFYNPADGSFDLRDVGAGNYVLRVDVHNPNPNPESMLRMNPETMRNMTEAERQAYYEEMAMAEQAAMARLAAPINVSSNLDGVTPSPVVLSPLTGRIRIEPDTDAKSVRLNQFGVELRPIGQDGKPMNAAGALSSPGVKTDGSFRMNGIAPGDYALRMQFGPAAGFFVKSVRIGDFDALNSPLTLPLRDSNAVLEVVISRNAGQIEGNAVSADGRPLPGAQIVLIPDGNRNRAELFRAIAADAAGHFTIPNVVPGAYRLAAWSSLEPFSWFDPVVIRQAEENGKAVQVGESSKQTINVQGIPVD
jgi:hypothetical protein